MSAEQGRQCVKDADKKLKGNFLGMNKDPDGAVDDLSRACNNFKVAQCCTSRSPNARLAPPQLCSATLVRQELNPPWGMSIAPPETFMHNPGS
jgi:hypothetical protein